MDRYPTVTKAGSTTKQQYQIKVKLTQQKVQKKVKLMDQ